MALNVAVIYVVKLQRRLATASQNVPSKTSTGRWTHLSQLVMSNTMCHLLTFNYFLIYDHDLLLAHLFFKFITPLSTTYWKKEGNSVTIFGEISHFGNILKALVNFAGVYLVFGKILNLLCQLLYAIGQFAQL